MILRRIVLDATLRLEICCAWSTASDQRLARQTSKHGIEQHGVGKQDSSERQISLGLKSRVARPPLPANTRGMNPYPASNENMVCARLLFLRLRVYLHRIQSLITPPPCLLIVLELMQTLFRRLSIMFLQIRSRKNPGLSPYIAEYCKD